MAFTLALVLDRALRDALIPIDGVSIGNPNDRTTWKAFYQTVATDAQRTQGDSLIATLQPDDPATLANLKADMAVSLADGDALKAAIASLYEAIPSPLLTLVQVRNRTIARLKA